MIAPTSTISVARIGQNSSEPIQAMSLTACVTSGLVWVGR
jgi:hypothetical protein